MRSILHLFGELMLATTCFVVLPHSTFAFVTKRIGQQQQRQSMVQQQQVVARAVREGTFGMGCFWDPAEQLLKVDGVIDTIAGYTGKPNAQTAPSYESVCYGREWVEAVRVIYDDDKISYQQLLDAMFEAQKPQPGSRQYASIIFPHDEEQQRMTQAWMETNASRQRKDGWKAAWTTIEPRSKFFKAEGYHQRYWQKQRPRFALIAGLLAVSTGLFNSIVPMDLQSTVEAIANASTIAIGVLITLERFLDAKVVEI
ncbi:peptide methionine sulfoxide reductase [Nitzschia inconspicua]|uniref:Protein-methionine-S-oxide reductase n=1 Tax=Nitzschia inconspicua TaxID=303405 RepID=A0A9K3PKU2_9STRA|nr:peptide methionine sulfoxide reductase [Nitzschia inconspicua]